METNLNRDKFSPFFNEGMPPEIGKGKKYQNIAVPSVAVLSSDDLDQIEGGADIKFNTSSDKPVKFFSKLFEARQMAHIFHLQVNGKPGSGWEHVALNEFYDGILPLIDDLIETYQGQYGTVEGYESIDTSGVDYNSLNYIKKFTQYLSENRKMISVKDSHLHNIIDEIVALSYKTIFKLTNMK